MDSSKRAQSAGNPDIVANRYFWLALVVSVLLVALMGRLHYGLAVAVGAAILIYLIICALPSRFFKGAIVSISVALLLVILIAPNFIKIKEGCPPGTKTKSHLVPIRNALADYAKNHDGFYPVDIAALADEGYLRDYPTNEFSFEHMVNISTRAEEIGPGSLVSGNFAYIPELQAVDGRLRATEYTLLAFGPGRFWLESISEVKPAQVVVRLDSDAGNMTDVW